VADAYVFKNKDFLNLECNSNRTPLGSAVAVKKGNDDLLARINLILDKLIRENRINQFVQDAKVFTDKI
jgi:ABC-type amino acid transport substrate-binding protein